MVRLESYFVGMVGVSLAVVRLESYFVGMVGVSWLW